MRKRLLLIDGTNFFFKIWGKQPLFLNGRNITALYSFHLNLCNLLRKFEDSEWECRTIVCWDGGYSERLKISTEAVEKGLIPMSYKQARREQHGNLDDSFNDDFIWQLQKAQEMLDFTRIAQCRVKGEEADDIAASFCKSNLGKWDEIILVTTDKDYYQLLWDGVKIFNSTKNVFLDKDFLKTEFNLDNADQWVDVGALAGETGDTIYGVPGIGYVTACKLISKYGTLDNIFKSANDMFRDWILKNGIKEFENQVKSGNFKTKSLKEAKILAYKETLDLAWKLKKMHTEIHLEIPSTNPNWEKLDEFFQDMKFQVSQKNFDTLLRRS